jgi:hypothetical protein
MLLYQRLCTVNPEATIVRLTRDLSRVSALKQQLKDAPDSSDMARYTTVFWPVIFNHLQRNYFDNPRHNDDQRDGRDRYLFGLLASSASRDSRNYT